MGEIVANKCISPINVGYIERLLNPLGGLKKIRGWLSNFGHKFRV